MGYTTIVDKGRNYICENNIVQKMLFLSDVSISKRRHKYIPQFFTSPMWPLSFGQLSVSKLHTCARTYTHRHTHAHFIIVSIWLMGFRSTDEWGTRFHSQLQVYCCLDVFLATALVWVSLQILAHLLGLAYSSATDLLNRTWVSPQAFSDTNYSYFFESRFKDCI